MVSVVIDKRESTEKGIRQLKRAVERAGTLAVVRRRRFYEKPSTKRQRQRAAARKRWQKKLQRENQQLTSRRDQFRDYYHFEDVIIDEPEVTAAPAGVAQEASVGEES